MSVTTELAHRTDSSSAFLVSNLGPGSNTTIPSKCSPISHLCLWIAGLHSPFLPRTCKGFSLQPINAKCRCQCVVVRLANLLGSTLLGMAQCHRNNAPLPLVRLWLKLCGLILASNVLLRLRL